MFRVAGEDEVAGPTPVLSLAIFRDSSRSQMLLGVRRRTPTSPRHPGVLSTPTMRLPATLMASIAESVGAPVSPGRDGMLALADPTPTPIGVANSMANPLSFAAEGLLARKLGWGNLLVEGGLSSHVRALAVSRAIVDGCELDLPEDTYMLTAGIELRTEVDLAPTASFARLDWVETELISDALAADDPAMLISGGESWEVCLYGLCVRSAAFAAGLAA